MSGWVVVQHVPYEGPGLIGEALAAAGRPFDVVHVARGDDLPDVGTIDGLVVMGGPMGVHDGDDHPWLVPERALLADAVRGGLPVLGVCLGAQQLAAALGARVSTGPVAEMGVGSVTLTEAGRRDPVFGLEHGGSTTATVPCVHWHQDTFAIPDGAVHLAGSGMYPNQAFRAGDRAYGLQFHVEVTSALAEAWRPHLPEGITLDDHAVAEVEAGGRRLLKRFVGLARG